MQQHNRKKSGASADSDLMEIDMEELKDSVEAIGGTGKLDDCLDGLTIVLSGEFQLITRTKLEELIRSMGAKVTSAVSGKTNYLVVGYKLEDGREVTQGSKSSNA